MKLLDIEKASQFIEDNIDNFHYRRLEKLKGLKLKEVLLRKNPYLFRAKNILTAQDLVKPLLDAYLSSQEETLFGEFLEQLAIFVCSQVYGGRKSSAEGIDLEFEIADTLYIVSIKSGPNWGNSRQILRMREDFRKAQKILRSNHPKIQIVAINGCCYGRDNRPEKGDYQKVCGQAFWTFISGNDKLYLDIIVPLGHRAKEKNDEFIIAYSRIVNEFTAEVLNDFCSNGLIDWEKLVKYISEQKVKR